MSAPRIATQQDHARAYDSAEEVLGGAFNAGYREGWIRSGTLRSGTAAYNSLSADYDRLIDAEPIEAWAGYRADFHAQLPLAALPLVGAPFVDDGGGTPAVPLREYDQPPAHWTADDGHACHPQAAEEWDWRGDRAVQDPFARSRARLQYAADRADPHAPDQMATVLRIDISRLLARVQWYGARFDLDPVSAALPACRPRFPREKVARLMLSALFGFEYDGEDLCAAAGEGRPNPRAVRAVHLADKLAQLLAEDEVTRHAG
ncbi:MAG: hypothetical protein ACK4TC_06155 [Sphingomonas pseudosanguinis]|uniref:hypothetical protein n=1 Tax=Sphingomonas pseudosanguinis TaxID=413712 RepID=UPI0039199314